MVHKPYNLSVSKVGSSQTAFITCRVAVAEWEGIKIAPWFVPLCAEYY